MSKKWYPVIDYSLCTECGNCTDMCMHGVFDGEKAPSPVVIFPEGCIDGCHGCGKKCPADAISYVGDKPVESNPCCFSCNVEEEESNEVDAGCCGSDGERNTKKCCG
jgi:NAD-dependent dihydropyrimidine dehydrogenase PreA subunit